MKKKGLNYGENFRIIYPFPVFPEPDLVTIGHGVLISGNVVFVTHDGSSHVVRTLNPELKKISTKRPIKVGNNVFIGNRSLIMSGVKIGNNVIIGANSIVTKDIPDNMVVAGMPAKQLMTLEEYTEKYKLKYGGNR